MITEMEVQQRNINTLLELVKENPELRIVPFVDTECVPSDDYSSWVAGWGNASIEEIWAKEGGEIIYIKSESYDKLSDDLWDEGETRTDEEIRNIINGYAWEKVIVVRIHTP